MQTIPRLDGVNDAAGDRSKIRLGRAKHCAIIRQRAYVRHVTDGVVAVLCVVTVLAIVAAL